MLEKENDIDKTENFIVNIALEICGLGLVVKIYFNTVLQNMMLFFKRKEWIYFKKVKEKMQIIKECIEITGSYELMSLWNKKNNIIQAIEEKYKCNGEFAYSEIIKLI